MKNNARFVFLLMFVCNFCPNSFADGHFYNTESIPGRIPYQRAFLIFHEGYETLILQSKFEFHGDMSNGRIGWVVPVPSTPELISFEPDKANIFFHRAARSTSPNTIRISQIFFLIFLLLSALFCAIYFGFFVILMLIYAILKLFYLPTQKWRLITKKYFLKYLPLFLAALFYMFYALPCLNRAKSYANIDIIKSEQAGIYDVKVIQSDSADAIIEWLNNNSFVYSDSDITVFNDYIEKQWCFVVAMIHPTNDQQKIEVRGMAAPLVLKFKTEKATYPLALTSLIGQDTEVLLYTLTENKQTCGSLMPLIHSKLIETDYHLENLFELSGIERQTITGNLPAKMNLCKFRKILKPEQMKTDLILESAQDNEPYRERKIIW